MAELGDDVPWRYVYHDLPATAFAIPWEIFGGRCRQDPLEFALAAQWAHSPSALHYQFTTA